MEGLFLNRSSIKMAWSWRFEVSSFTDESPKQLNKQSRVHALVGDVAMT